MSRTVAEILDAAADLIEPEGAWMQGDLYVIKDGVAVCWCALGAIVKAGGSAGWLAVPTIEDSLPETGPSDLRPLAAWNDAPGRTQAEVVAKLREAAELARSLKSDGTGS